MVEFSDAGQRVRKVHLPKVVKTDAEWRKQLSPAAFSITRENEAARAADAAAWVGSAALVFTVR